MVAIQRGTERPNDVVIIQGHIDSRVTDVDERRPSDAPGANDDGSGTAAVIEAARVLSKHKFPGTIVYAALLGRGAGALRRQGARQLRQGAGLERRHRPQQRHHRQQLRRRTACAIRRMRACCRKGRARRGRRSSSAATHSLGGENDAPSRNISRFLDSLADRLKIGLDVRQIWRTDRFGRGGDHIPFLRARLSRRADQRRDRELQLAAPGSADRERHPLRRHDRPCRFRLSRQDDQAERRRARRDRQRPAAARAEGRRGGEHGYDADVGSRCRARPATSIRWRRTDANQLGA